MDQMLKNAFAFALFLLSPIHVGNSWAGSVVSLTPGDDLNAALAGAGPGTVIDLAPGNYGELIFKRGGGSETQPIILRSKDPKLPARISTMDLREVNNMVLEDLVLDYVSSPEDGGNFRPFQVFTSRNLTIRNVEFDGDLAKGGNPEDSDTPTGFGLAVRASSGIVIEDCSFHDFYRGMVISDVVDVAVQRNDITAIRMDGMNFAQVERVLIEDNHIHDFKRVVDSADHADMIQFWTNGTERPSRDIMIRRNVLNSGVGAFTQSIFMRNELVDRGRAGAEMFYRNVTIEDNIIINAHLHGITLGETDGVTIRRNTLIHNPRSDGTHAGSKRNNDALWQPQIRLADRASNVTIDHNIAAVVPKADEHPAWQISDNLEVQDQSRLKPNFYDTIFIAARTGDPRDLSSFRYLPESPVAKQGIGAPQLMPLTADRDPNALLPSDAPPIRTTQDPQFPSRYLFDALTGGKLEGLQMSTMAFDWDFGDGTTGKGATIKHEFATPGEYLVTLQVTSAYGHKYTSTSLVHPRAPEVLHYNPAEGTISSFARPEPAELDLVDAIGRIRLGGTAPVTQIPPDLISPMFGAEGFEISMHVRADLGYKSAGELLRIHPFLIVTVQGRGSIEVLFTTATSSQLRFSTFPSSILSGEWVDLMLRYDNPSGRFELMANGKVIGAGATSGVTPPQQSWGLSLGNPFNTRKSFTGEVAGLVLKVGEHGPAARP